MLSLALGEDPTLPNGSGPYERAAKWYFRWFADGVVHSVPTRKEIDRIEEEIPGVQLHMVPEEGQRLSRMPEQDSYSFELAHIFTGGDGEADMREKYDGCVAALSHAMSATAPGSEG